jgi:capsular polysaccharide biosynthesis protein
VWLASEALVRTLRSNDRGAVTRGDMDLFTYWQVVRRQRRLIVLGGLVTAALAAFALFKVSTSGLELRSPPTYRASSKLFVTQSGFPWGRTALDEYIRVRGANSAVPRFADPSRMEYLASLYSELAMSDAVRRIAFGNRELPSSDDYEVVALKAPDGRPMPLIEVAGLSSSAERAVAIANRVAGALQTFVARRQTQSKIPESTRIVLPVVDQAEQAEVFEGVKLTTAVMILLLGTVATLFAAFTTDNVKRQRRLAAELESVEQDVVGMTRADDSAVHSLGSPAGKTRAGSASRPL